MSAELVLPAGCPYMPRAVPACGHAKETRTACRRLAGKTQVFPLTEADVTHHRMTHTLEVASVGRSLGRSVAADAVTED